MTRSTLTLIATLCLFTGLLVMTGCDGAVGYLAFADYGPQVLTWAGVGLSFLIGRYLLGRIGSDAVREIVERALHEVGAAVLEVGQTYADDLKLSAADGKLTKAEQVAAKDKAVAIARTNLGKKGLARLARVIGADGVERWLATRTEAAVAAVKRSTGSPVGSSKALADPS